MEHFRILSGFDKLDSEGREGERTKREIRDSAASQNASNSNDGKSSMSPDVLQVDLERGSEGGVTEGKTGKIIHFRQPQRTTRLSEVK